MAPIPAIQHFVTNRDLPRAAPVTLLHSEEEAADLRIASRGAQLAITAISLLCTVMSLGETSAPRPPGKLVDLGGHRLHVNCSGQGSPVVVVENGLGDFSFDWILVQEKVSRFSRICTYDRAGYAWSDAGPKPRTFDQINLELRDALKKLGEKGPFVLVGHSFGGPVVRNFARIYPEEVAGIVLVDAAHEGLRVGIGGKNTMRLGQFAKGRAIPPPHEELRDTDKPSNGAMDASAGPAELDAMYKVLPPAQQALQRWAQSQP